MASRAYSAGRVPYWAATVGIEGEAESLCFGKHVAHGDIAETSGGVDTSGLRGATAHIAVAAGEPDLFDV